MVVLALLVGALASISVSHTAVSADTSVSASGGLEGEHPADTGVVRFLRVPIDTPRTRPRAVEISDWYARRLTLHRWVAYGTIPVFGAQWLAGQQLLNKSRDAPTWAKTTHRVGATTLAGMFTVNTVTGAWNWWDSRAQSRGRVFRTIHAFSMIAADAAFTYTGAKLSNDAETDKSARRLHHNVALYSMGVTVLSGAAMKLWNK